STHPPGKGKRLSGRAITMSSQRRRALRFDDRKITLEPFELELHRRYGYGVGAGIEIWQGLGFRDPATIEVVGQGLRARLVEDVDGDVLAELAQRGDAMAGEVVDRIGPVLERRVIGDPGLQSDRLIAGFSG